MRLAGIEGRDLVYADGTREAIPADVFAEWYGGDWPGVFLRAPAKAAPGRGFLVPIPFGSSRATVHRWLDTIRDAPVTPPRNRCRLSPAQHAAERTDPHEATPMATKTDRPLKESKAKPAAKPAKKAAPKKAPAKKS